MERDSVVDMKKRNMKREEKRRKEGKMAYKKVAW
jgi:hypothetical protein